MPTLEAPPRPGTPLATYCAALGVRTADLADACLVNRTYMSSVIHGQRHPSRRLRRAISEALSVPEPTLWPAAEGVTQL